MAKIQQIVPFPTGLCLDGHSSDKFTHQVNTATNKERSLLQKN